MKGHITAVFIIIILSFFVWHKILNQTLTNEGFYYFEVSGLINFQEHKINQLGGLDNLARLIFQILIPVFQDNILLYMVFQLFIMTLLFITVYIVLYKITSFKMLGLIVSILFLSSYTGLYDLLATGNYQRFIQRVPNLIPQLISFYYLTKYYRDQKPEALILSLFFFILSFEMAHFSVYLLPMFVIYALISSKWNLKSIFINCLLSVLFVTIALTIISQSRQAPPTTVLQFIITKPNIIEGMLYHIPMLIFPTELIKLIARLHFPNPISFPYTPIVRNLILPALGIIIFGLQLIKKREPSLFKLYLTCLLSLPLINFLNLYSYLLNPTKTFGSDRYLFIPSLIVSIILGLFFYAIFKTKSKFHFKPLILVILMYVIYNTWLIWQNIDANQYRYNADKKFISYIKIISPQFKNKSVLVAPREFLWTNPLISKFYGYPTMQYVDFAKGWEENIKGENKNNVFIIDYDWEGVAGDQGSNQGKLVDLTQKFRKGEKVTYTHY